MHIVEVFKEKLDFNLDICWFKLEKYTFSKLNFNFWKYFFIVFFFTNKVF